MNATLDKTQRKKLIGKGFHPPSECPVAGILPDTEDSNGKPVPCPKCLPILEPRDDYTTLTELTESIDRVIQLEDPDSRYPTTFITINTATDEIVMGGHGEVDLKLVLKTFFEANPAVLTHVIKDTQAGELGKGPIMAFMHGLMSFLPPSIDERDTPSGVARQKALDKIEERYKEMGISHIFNGWQAMNRIVDLSMMADPDIEDKMKKKLKTMQEDKDPMFQ